MTRHKNEFANDLRPFLDEISDTLIQSLSFTLRETSENGFSVALFGNGGSASIASHVAVDLTKAAGCKAVTFFDPSLLTCFSNDYGYENCFAQCVEQYLTPNDVCIFISSSGQSQNIINATKAAVSKGLYTITLSGFSSKNPLRAMGNRNIWINSENYNVVETMHQVWLLAIVEKMRVSEPIKNKSLSNGEQ